MDCNEKRRRTKAYEGRFLNPTLAKYARMGHPQCGRAKDGPPAVATNYSITASYTYNAPFLAPSFTPATSGAYMTGGSN